METTLRDKVRAEQGFRSNEAWPRRRGDIGKIRQIVDAMANESIIASCRSRKFSFTIILCKVEQQHSFAMITPVKQ